MNLFTEIFRQINIANRQFSEFLKDEDPYAPSREEFDKLEAHFKFLQKYMSSALDRDAYDYAQSLAKEVFRTVRDNDTAFTAPEKIYDLLGMSSEGGPVSEITGGLMSAIERAAQAGLIAERQAEEDEVYSSDDGT